MPGQDPPLTVSKNSLRARGRAGSGQIAWIGVTLDSLVAGTSVAIFGCKFCSMVIQKISFRISPVLLVSRSMPDDYKNVKGVSEEGRAMGRVAGASGDVESDVTGRLVDP